MTLKLFSLVIIIISYFLLIMSTVYGFNQAKKVHHVTMKQVKNEIPNGFIFRGICSLIYYLCMFDWIFNFKIIPWTYFKYSEIINWVGIILLIFTVGLFWLIHYYLGSNYHGPMKIHDNHQLVTKGPYAFARHPTYIAFPLLHLSFSLITHNWLLLLSGMVMAIYVNSNRIIIEEKLLIDRFGNEYLNYMNKVGKYYPRIIKKKRETSNKTSAT